MPGALAWVPPLACVPQPSALPLSFAALGPELCACNAPISDCMNAANVWRRSWFEELDDEDVEELEPLALDEPSAPICESAFATAASNPTPGGGPGGDDIAGIPPT